MAAYKVLIPLDGSRIAERSLTYLRPLKHLGEIELRLVSVVDEPAGDLSAAAKEPEERERNVLTTYLHEVAGDIRKHLAIAVEAVVVEGNAGARIIAEAAAFGADLLVISTHGRSGISRWRFGSVADKVVRGAGCATLLVGPGTTEEAQWLEAELIPPFAKILVPLDGSPHAEEAIPVARLYAERFGSEVHLLRVVSFTPIDAGLGYEGSYGPGILEALEDAAREYLAGVAKQFQAAKAVKIAVVVGPVATKVEDYAAENGIDLVVMTSHGRGGVVRAALGSVTDRLLGGKAPVLVVRHAAAPA
jgi:nucleotide-binding universal stress UspA family protein